MRDVLLLLEGVIWALLFAWGVLMKCTRGRTLEDWWYDNFTWLIEGVNNVLG